MLLDKVLYGETPRRSPAPYPLTAVHALSLKYEWITKPNRLLSSFHSHVIASVSPFWAFYQPKLQFSLLFHILQPSHTLKAWKWYPFRVVPLPKGHFREYRRGFKSALSFDQQYVQLKQAKSNFRSLSVTKMGFTVFLTLYHRKKITDSQYWVF